MINYNNVPNKTDWGEAANLVNDNFSKTNTKIVQLETLMSAGLKYMGVVDALANLPTSPADGDAYLVKTGIAGFLNGEIYVRRSTGWLPTGLSGFPSDVLSATLTNLAVGDILEYDGKTWINKTKQNAGIALSGGSTKTVQEVENSLQTQINQINEDMKSYAERYEFQMILGLNNDKSSYLQGSYNLNCDSDVIVQNKTYTSRYENKSLTKTPDMWSSEVNDTICIFANNVDSLNTCNTQAAALILINSNINRYMQINLVSPRIPYINMSAVINLSSFCAHDTIFENLTFQNNLRIVRVDTYDMHELKSLHIGNAKSLEVIGVTDSPKFDTFTFDGQFGNLVVLNFFNSPLITLDTIMAVGYAWTSRVGKDAGFLRITTAIFNAMTQDQKNVFINKNINIEHQ